jgi:aryl-alcohol dehydrogenase-like predicted oxidoreductase
MESRTAGTSSLSLSVLGFGTWQFGSAGADDYWGLEFTDELALALTKQATDAGITYFDTAEDYAKGGSETQLGKAIKALEEPTRAKVVVGSKILPNHCNDVRSHCAATLARLGVECIDLYMVHWPIDPNSMAHFAGGHTASGGRVCRSGQIEPSIRCGYSRIRASWDRTTRRPAR